MEKPIIQNDAHNASGQNPVWRKGVKADWREAGREKEGPKS